MIGADKAGPGPSMIPRTATAPVLRRRCAGARGIHSAVEAVIGRRGLSGITRPPTPRTLALFALALTEVLHTVDEHRQKGHARGLFGGLTVELWIEPGLAVVCVGFVGPALPEWLLTAWDRCEEPGAPDAAADCGWGWLFVREALDGVSLVRSGDRQLLFLEKRL